MTSVLTGVLDWLRRARWLLRGLSGKANTESYAAYWAETDPDADVVMRDWGHPHRAWLRGEIERLGPIESALEIGCGSGANLAELARLSSVKRLVGIDLNARAIEAGQRLMRLHSLPAVSLHVENVLNLSRFQDREFDLVFTDATLIYVGPRDIRRVLEEILRISNRNVLLLELHQDGQRGGWRRAGVHTQDGWLRDYVALAKEVSPNSSVRSTRLPLEAWPSGRWPDYGHSISITSAGRAAYARERAGQE